MPLLFFFFFFHALYCRFDIFVISLRHLIARRLRFMPLDSFPPFRDDIYAKSADIYAIRRRHDILCHCRHYVIFCFFLRYALAIIASFTPN